MNNRRHNLPFDPSYFEKQSKRGKELDINATFREIYKTNHWAGKESISGPGSGEDQTRVLKVELPKLLFRLEVESLLDLPCGDFSWMKETDLSLDSYIGADIVPELIQKNREQYEDNIYTFEVLDLTADPLPDVDLILCRDCLVHFSFDDIAKAVQNLKRSSITWFLSTTFTECERNEDIPTGDWRVLNLELPPFSFPVPEYLLNEQCTEGNGQFRDKSLGLWLIRELPEFLILCTVLRVLGESLCHWL